MALSSSLLRAVALLLAGLCLGSCSRSNTHFTNIDLSGASYARDFRLQDPEGRIRTLSDFRGKVVAMFFGYTQCPDVCPAALGQMRAVIDALGPDGERVQVLFVTIDPERDTAELLRAYVPAFHPSFLGLRTDVAATQALAREYRVFFERSPGPTPTSYTVSHTTGLYLYDPTGALRLLAKHDSSVDGLVADIRILLSAADADGSIPPRLSPRKE